MYAMELAEKLDSHCFGTNNTVEYCKEIAAELRRLAQENERLVAMNTPRHVSIVEPLALVHDYMAAP